MTEDPTPKDGLTRNEHTDLFHRSSVEHRNLQKRRSKETGKSVGFYAEVC
jgi:hypothetical protein